MMRIILSLFLFLAVTSGAQAQSASAEANKAVVQRALTAMQQGDLPTLNAIFDPNGPWHIPNGTTIKQGGPYTDLHGSCPMCAALQNRKIAIDVMLAEGDLVAVRSIWTGNYMGTVRGVAIAGKPVTVVYMNIYRVARGRIVENWALADGASLARQLGFAITPPDAPTK
jgi:ketosteroid isomerase-like protein